MSSVALKELCLIWEKNLEFERHALGHGVCNAKMLEHLKLLSFSILIHQPIDRFFFKYVSHVKVPY